MDIYEYVFLPENIFESIGCFKGVRERYCLGMPMEVTILATVISLSFGETRVSYGRLQVAIVEQELCTFVPSLLFQKYMHSLHCAGGEGSE